MKLIFLGLIAFVLPHLAVAQSCDDTNTQLALQLRDAFHFGSQQDVRDLIAKGACINGPKNAKGYSGFIIPIIDWSYEGNLNVLKFILSLGADPNRTEWDRFNRPFSALQVASERGQDLQFIKTLVESGATVNIGDNEHDAYLSPLGGSVSRGHMDVFDYLISKGAKPIGNELLLITNDFFVDRGPTPVTIVTKLLKLGVSPSVKDDLSDTPLHIARRADVIQTLIEAGAPLEAQDYYGNTPLFGRSTWDGKSTKQEMCGTMRAFIAAKADFSHKNKKGQNVLLAILSGGEIGAYPDQLLDNQACAILELLQSNVAIDVNAAEIKTGLTPLMYAANWTLSVHSGVQAQRRKDILQKLIERGADLKAVDSQGRSVISFARDPEVKAILSAAGA